MYIAAVLTICAVVKAMAMLEWAPLYRLFLFIPAVTLAFFHGAEYTEQAGIYTFPDMILDYSCSGIHFFMIALVTTGLTKGGNSEHRVWFRVWSLRIFSAFALTIVLNTMRIGLLIKLTPFITGKPWLHEAVGTLVFFSGLLAYHYAIQLTTHSLRKQYARQTQTT